MLRTSAPRVRAVLRMLCERLARMSIDTHACSLRAVVGWLFAAAACVEKPLDADTAAALRCGTRAAAELLVAIDKGGESLAGASVRVRACMRRVHCEGVHVHPYLTRHVARTCVHMRTQDWPRRATSAWWTSMLCSLSREGTFDSAVERGRVQHTRQQRGCPPAPEDEGSRASAA